VLLMKSRMILAILLAMTLLLSIAKVYALSCRVEIHDNYAIMRYSCTATISNVTKVEKNYWHGFKTAILSVKYSVKKILGEVLGRHLSRDLGYKNVTVEVLDFSYSVTEPTTGTLKIDVSVTIKINIKANTTMFGKSICIRFRAMAPDINSTEFIYNNIPLNPAKCFFIYLKPFSVPLEKWRRTYNGTHTVFSYYVANMTLTTPFGTKVTVDPSEAIIVEGEATASGDYIEIKTVPTTTIAIVIAVIIALVVLVAIYLTKLRKKVVEVRTIRYI